MTVYLDTSVVLSWLLNQDPTTGSWERLPAQSDSRCGAWPMRTCELNYMRSSGRMPQTSMPLRSV